MDTARWKQINDIMNAALDLEPEARDAFLRKICRDDADLRSEVENMLAVADVTFLEKPALASPELSPEPRSYESGYRIGPYRIVQEIGRGGMGAVYMAVREGEGFQQEVALKVLQFGMASADLIQRFHNERQIMANLNHHNIAKLLDGGATEDGLPYFVMEYVDGVPIHDYCRVRRLSVPARLRLFRKVCSAVHFAHQNLVVHRDLKPGNILVTAEGEPKLLDFGIAKLLRPGTFEPVTMTTAGVRPMTPEYASPEQVTGEAITTESDIYSLGLLLYELLCGHRAHRFANRSEEEVRRVVCETYPPKPSQVMWERYERPSERGPIVLTPEIVSRERGTDPKRLARQLGGDLDNMVMMAISKDPDHRYASAEQFSHDIINYLGGFPILARGKSSFYLAQRFFERHQFAILMISLMGMMLFLFSLTTLVQHRQTQREHRIAEMEKQKARQLNHFFSALFAEPDFVVRNRSEISTERLTSRAVHRIRAGYPNEPEVQAAMMHAVGNVCLQLGALDQAHPLLEEALRIRGDVLGKDHLDYAESLRDLGTVRLRQGRLVEAECRLADARKALENIKMHDSPSYAGVIEELAQVYGRMQRFDEAEALHWQALEVVQSVEPRDPEMVTRILLQLAHHFIAVDRPDRARVVLNWALSEQVASGSDDGLAHTLIRLATLEHRCGRDEHSRIWAERAGEVAAMMFHEKHPLQRQLSELREIHAASLDASQDGEGSPEMPMLESGMVPAEVSSKGAEQKDGGQDEPEKY
ncbi:Non-specific serine/threonine protein kinase [Sulfidibacter corallicola]|uniref:Serine/threonine protein kinase n=1 Tax=Sulfidibacter corallicola TaxID=2818388 RepID=A0A8A4TQH5_SULCO|nr:serine/threonine-protein kinase [Sulfidibacter corallicola]QTD51342.1 serine/threonine protein kinase [Sulfidibacter corallicola]